jgi:hypothetical protein
VLLASEPALSAEEWRRLGDGSPVDEWFKAFPNVGSVQAVAVSNHLLPDSDPRKITRAWAEAIRQAAHDIEDADVMVTEVPPAHAPILRSLADALESYLPPEG